MNQFSSLFCQMLMLFSRRDFAQAVRETGAERHSKGFCSWDQFVSMLFCQIGRAHSLREICGGLATATGKLRHLGLQQAPKRSTLSYANSHRPWQLYQRVFFQMLERCQTLAATRNRKFRFKNKIITIDSTVIDLCLSTFDWARFRRAKGAVKLHLLLDHDGYLPSFAVITDGKRHDVKVAKKLSFPPGAILLFDRAYIDFRWLSRLFEDGVYFVTKLKSNIHFEVVDYLPVSGDVLVDSIIRLSGPGAPEKCPHLLRRVIIWDPEKRETVAFLTNHFKLAAPTIAAVYKDRWQIELFFKALKQNLKIKTFLGTTPNAVKTQIWTALIAMLVVKFLQLKSSFNWSLSTLVALLRMNLLTYRDLWAWLDAPFETPVLEPQAVQLKLNLS